jgi:hypothetical protein
MNVNEMVERLRKQSHDGLQWYGPPQIQLDAADMLVELREENERLRNMSDATAASYLESLVNALDNAFISTWQSTAEWSAELKAARAWLSARAALEPRK